MHTINSRQAMRERFKSHDLGRTSLSQFQWSQPLTLIGSNDPPSPEVSGSRLIEKMVPHLNSYARSHTKPNATAVGPGFGREVPQLRRTASAVASSYKQTMSPTWIADEPPLHSVTINSAYRS